MSEPIRYKLVSAAMSRARALTDNNNDRTIRHEFRNQTILNDESLTADEQSYAIGLFNRNYDRNTVFFDKGTKRLCETCLLECFATSYCEHCIRTYLKNNFSNWISGNNDIDNLIQKCQMELCHPRN